MNSSNISPEPWVWTSLFLSKAYHSFINLKPRDVNKVLCFLSHWFLGMCSFLAVSHIASVFFCVYEYMIKLLSFKFQKILQICVYLSNLEFGQASANHLKPKSCSAMSHHRPDGSFFPQTSYCAWGSWTIIKTANCSPNDDLAYGEMWTCKKGMGSHVLFFPASLVTLSHCSFPESLLPPSVLVPFLFPCFTSVLTLGPHLILHFSPLPLYSITMAMSMR